MTLNAPIGFARLNTAKLLRIGRTAVACVGALLLMSTTVLAQSVSVAPRVFAASQPVELDDDITSEDLPLWETSIAVGPSRAIAVYHNQYWLHTNPPAPNPSAECIRYAVGYAVYSREGDPDAGWIGTGVIPNGDYKGGIDPVIAADPVTGDFMACCMAAEVVGCQGPTSRVIATAKYDASLGSWGPWIGRTSEYFPIDVDKPWIVAGKMDQGYHEYYVTYWYWGTGAENRDRYGYLHTINGGSSWYNGTITVDGDFVRGRPVAAQPTVAGDGPLYVAYVADDGSAESPAHGTRIGFLIGTDHLGTMAVDFDYLYASEDVPLTLDFKHLAGTSHVATLLPGGPGTMEVRTVPWLLADPTNANRLFLVYHTTKANSWTEADGHADFDIYARVLTKSGGYWSVGTEVKVNDASELNPESDQFLPSPTVDTSGRLHITWYDDRLYNVSSDQADGTATPNPKFDVYYAMGTVGANGLDFNDNELLYGTGDEEDEPGLNYVRLHDPDPDWEFPDRPGEYNGIAVDGDMVWTTFTGTSAQDDNQVNNPSVIWSSLIVWTP